MAEATTTLPHVRPVTPPVPAKAYNAQDPRLLNLVQRVLPDDLGDDPVVKQNAAARPVGLLGVPFDGSVQGRKGCAEGPAAIREAFRYFGTYDVETDTQLLGLRVRDHGDVVVDQDDTHATHDRATAAVSALIDAGELPVVLGGDHSLTYAHVRGLAERVEGPIGIVVVDAHYDLRAPAPDGSVSSGTPFYRILEELRPDAHGKRVEGKHLYEIGIRPYANSAHLARYAKEHDVRAVTGAELRARGLEGILAEATERLADVDHLWLSVDIDGVDQAHAPGCSAPTPGGVMPHELEAIARWAAKDPRFAGMDLLETAPGLDPSGNTARVAAGTVAHLLGGHVSRYG